MSGPSERDEIAAFVASHHMLFGTNDTRMWSYCHCTPNLELVGAEMPVPDMDDWFWVAGIAAYRAHVANALTDLLAERDRRTAAKTLREAADELDRRWYEREAEMPASHDTHCWLDGHEAAEQAIRDRADRIERGAR